MRYLSTLVLCFSLSVAAAAGQGTPSIRIETTRNVGTVSQGDVIKQVFAYANIGSAPLEIFAEKSS